MSVKLWNISYPNLIQDIAQTLSHHLHYSFDLPSLPVVVSVLPSLVHLQPLQPVQSYSQYCHTHTHSLTRLARSIRRSVIFLAAMCIEYVKQFEDCGHVVSFRTVPCDNPQPCNNFRREWNGTMRGHCSKVVCMTPPETDSSGSADAEDVNANADAGDAASNNGNQSSSTDSSSGSEEDGGLETPESMLTTSSSSSSSSSSSDASAGASSSSSE